MGYSFYRHKRCIAPLHIHHLFSVHVLLKKTYELWHHWHVISWRKNTTIICRWPPFNTFPKLARNRQGALPLSTSGDRARRHGAYVPRSTRGPGRGRALALEERSQRKWAVEAQGSEVVESCGCLALALTLAGLLTKERVIVMRGMTYDSEQRLRSDGR